MWRYGIASHSGNYCRAVFDCNSVIIVSHDGIVFPCLPVVIADGSADSKRVAVTLGNASGGY